MTPATSAGLLTMPASWARSTSSGPVGVAEIHAGDVPGGVRIELDQAAAAAIGGPAFVVVELAARVLTVMPCDAGDAGARGAVATRDGGLTFTARIAIKRRAVGSWPAWQHGAGLALDLAGDQAREAG